MSATAPASDSTDLLVCPACVGGGYVPGSSPPEPSLPQTRTPKPEAELPKVGALGRTLGRIMLVFLRLEQDTAPVLMTWLARL